MQQNPRENSYKAHALKSEITAHLSLTVKAPSFSYTWPALKATTFLRQASRP